jgi:gliding motility-associated-like protein
MRAREIYGVWNIVLVITFLFSVDRALAQNCDPITPFFQADLSNSPDATWTSPLTNRQGQCCDVTNPDVCVEFEITLHEDAIAINFEISSGAVPPGALFYQINCGPEIPVGDPICLSGAGPHLLTFCKPGNNDNTFSITSYPSPSIGPDISLNTGCTDYIFANYYDVSTVTWKSVFPGDEGDYNDYLDCLSGCDTVNVAATTSSPPEFVDFEVCGYDAGGCFEDPICYTIRVQFLPQLIIETNPNETHLCFDDPTATITALAQFGIPPYTYEWSDGQVGSTAELGVGTHYVMVTDSDACFIALDSVVITQDELPIVANAGVTADFCNIENLEIQLSGQVQTASGGIWSGGNGNFSPNNSTLDAVYTPATSELNQGFIALILTSTGNNGCAPGSDTVTFTFHHFTNDITLNTTHPSCFDFADGYAGLEVNGPFAPYQFSWNEAPYDFSQEIMDLPEGDYSVTLLNDLGCDTTLSFSLEHPPLLSTSLEDQEDVLCHGDETGWISTSSTGGTEPYSFTWSGSPSITANAEDLGQGSYTLYVEDAHGCIDSLTAIITQPDALSVDFELTEPDCHGGQNGSIAATINGGVETYTITWSNDQQTEVINELAQGTYEIQIIDANGCELMEQVYLGQPEAIQATISGAAIVCPGEETILGVQASGGTGDLTYEWSPGGAVSDSLTIYPMQSGFFSNLVTDENGCSVLLTTSVSVIYMNQADLMATALPDVICLGDQVELTAIYTGEDTETVTVTWEHCTSCSTSEPLFETPEEDISYVLTATNLCGEIIYDTVFITVHPLPEVSIPENIGAYCPEELVSFFSDGESHWGFDWDFGDGNTSNSENPQHFYQTHGSFIVTLTVTDENGCSSQSENPSIVTVNPQAIADFSLSSFDFDMLSPDVTFYNHSLYADNYFWNFGDGGMSHLHSPIYTYGSHGNYVITLFASNEFGCNDSTSLAINIKPAHALFVPNAFTPDGDDYNNIFSAEGFGISEDGFQMLIFNRWGEVVFESYDMRFGWNGKYGAGGPEVKDGVYIWKIIYKDLNNTSYQKEGHVTVLR